MFSCKVEEWDATTSPMTATTSPMMGGTWWTQTAFVCCGADVGAKSGNGQEAAVGRWSVGRVGWKRRSAQDDLILTAGKQLRPCVKVIQEDFRKRLALSSGTEQ